jgi:hypothetical protein
MRGIINTIKQYLASQNQKYFLTNADVTAVEFYEKCGFSRNVSLVKKYYTKEMAGFNKAQVMECRLTNA